MIRGVSPLWAREVKQERLEGGAHVWQIRETRAKSISGGWPASRAQFIEAENKNLFE